MLKKFLSVIILILVLSLGTFGMSQSVFAASVTTFSDTLSTLTASTAANHTIYFVTPTGVASGNTVTLTFDADFTGVASIDDTDLDFAEGDSGTCTTATYTEETLVASGATSSQFNASASGQVITFESGGASATVTAARCIRIKIGTNAVSGVTGGEQISNGVAANAHSVVVGGTFGDSGTAAIDIIADDSVNVTASVDPTITFSISDTTIGFGSLSLTTGRWATGDTLGEDASEILPTAAHTMSIATNAGSGYTVTYLGPTLTSGANTLAGATTIGGGGDSDGTPGTEQFGIAVSVSDNATINSAYTRTATTKWRFIANSLLGIVQETVPTDTEVISVSYLANISPTTPAGSYATDVTYIATGNF